MGRTVDTIVGKTDQLARVLHVVGESVGLVVEYLDREAGKPQDRRGGYFCLAEDAPGAPVILHARIGLVHAEKGDKYRAFSREKSVRLAGRPADRSSWETRDEAHDMYGGAIRPMSPSPLLSFSGFPEHADEAAMLLAVLKFPAITSGQARAIAQISSNELYRGITSWLQGHNAWNDGIWTVPQE